MSQLPLHSVLTAADALTESIENASANTRMQEIILFMIIPLSIYEIIGNPAEGSVSDSVLCAELCVG